MTPVDYLDRERTLTYLRALKEALESHPSVTPRDAAVREGGMTVVIEILSTLQDAPYYDAKGVRR